MKNANLKLIVAVFGLIGAFGGASPICLADEADPCATECSSYWSNCGVGRCCDRCCSCCDKICQFRLIDGCTKCAWSRTWHAPNPVMTPLRQYYVPRPPQCCWYNGCEACMANPGSPAWDMAADTNCPNRMTLASTDGSPEAVAGLSPAQFERLGRIPNELDVVAPVGGAAPAPGRPQGR